MPAAASATAPAIARASALGVAPAACQNHQQAEREQPGDAPHDDRCGRLEAHQQKRGQLNGAVEDRRLRDPSRPLIGGLRRRQRDEGQAHGPGGADGEPGRPGPRPPQEDRGLRRERERREVVGQEPERRHGGPAPEPPRRRVVQRACEQPQGDGRQQDEQRVRARLLRVPDQQRVHGDEGRRRDAGTLRDQLPPGEVGEGDRRGAEERRQQPQGHLTAAQNLGHGPLEGVEQRRRGL